MRVLVSGSTGLIGSALVAALPEAGHEPVRLVRRREPGDLPSRRWDPATGEIDDDALDGIDAVIHLAGEGVADRRWTDAQKQRILDSRVNGTTLLSSAITRATTPPAVFLSGSAIGAYGDRGDEVLTEVSERGDGFLADVVAAWEGAADVPEPPTRTVLFRTGIVLAPKGGALGPQLPLFKLGLGGRIGSGRQWWSWISIDDMVGALVWLLENEVHGPVNMTAPNPQTNADFTATLGRVLRRPTVIPVPKLALHAKLGKELTAEVLLASQRVKPTALLEGGYRFIHAELEPALRAILDRPA
ncbi:MAG: TIGR01777 family oxidoreductase [Acidimicrobiales bacterium]|nr:TIGR01777 family oxidoreductase [Acidimicrobiales bacterium]